MRTTGIGWVLAVVLGAVLLPIAAPGHLMPTGATAPGRPEHLTARPMNGSVELQWSISGSPTAAGVRYTVWLSASPSGPWAAALNTTAVEATVPDLENGFAYSFCVSAADSAGNSSCSTAVTATPESVPYPPTVLLLVALSDSTLRVAWSPPVFDGGYPIESYRVGVATSVHGPYRLFSTGTVPGAVLDDLASATRYFVVIIAENAFGASAPSAVRNATTLTDPNGSMSPVRPTPVRIGPPDGRGALPALLPTLVLLGAIGLWAGALWGLLRGRHRPGRPSPPRSAPSSAPPALGGARRSRAGTGRRETLGRWKAGREIGRPRFPRGPGEV